MWTDSEADRDDTMLRFMHGVCGVRLRAQRVFLASWCVLILLEEVGRRCSWLLDLTRKCS